MLADTLNELHEMADNIGIARKWFQQHASHPHYDICKSKRTLAIKFGAIEVNRRELVRIMRRTKHLKVEALIEPLPCD